MRALIFATAAAVTSGALISATPAQAGLDPFVGEIMIIPYNFCPRGYLPADGRLLGISQNTALFSLLGTTYGGNGQTTFALPAIAPTTTANGATVNYCIATEGIFPSRN